MKLYYFPGACSLSPHIVAREAGLPVEMVQVDMSTGKAGDRDFGAINPKGYVPALELDEGGVLTEGTAIVQYLADRKPASGLAPAAGTLERYRLQEWLNYIATEVHKSSSPLFNPKAPPEWKEVIRKELGKKLDWLAQELTGRPYLMGETFTVADAYLFTILGWTKWWEIDLAKWPALEQYSARVGARPGVKKALEEEGLG